MSRRFPLADLAGWRLWLVRLAMAIGAPLLLFGMLEGGLHVFGYGFPTTFFVPAGDGTNERINDRFTAPFFPPDAEAQSWPVLLPIRKPSGTLRIFILGESAAHGTPDPSFGFARILEVMLRREYPHRRFEVVNAALRGINSHLILPIARECAAREPDLFIAYMGNNEVTGLYAPEPGAWNLTPHLHLLRLLQQARATRSAQLLQAALHHADAPHAEAAQDMEFFRARRLAADDPRRLAVADNFRENLRAICDTMLASGAKAIVSTVAVNLHDCPPLASLHRSGLSPADAARWEELYTAGVTAESVEDFDLAIHHYIGAAFIDDHFAELQFRIARCYHPIRHDALQHGEYARMRYALACDWDALQFRTDSRLNTIIREIAANRQAEGLFLTDAAQAFTESTLSERGTPGDRLFYEHVHLRFDGDYLLATTLLPSVVQALALDPPAQPLPTRDECAAALAYNDWDELDMLSAVAQATARPPFLDQLDHTLQQAQAEHLTRDRLQHFNRDEMQRALAVCRDAAQRHPDDWQLRYILGRTLYSFQDPGGAVEPLESAVRLMPYYVPSRLMLADCLTKTGHPGEAALQLRVALKLDPHSAAVRAALEHAQ